MEIALSTTADGIELQRNPSGFKMTLVKRVFHSLMEQWFNGIVTGLKDADLIVLSVTSVLAGLSCLEKFPHTKAVGIYTFPCIRTAEFTPPGLGSASTSLFSWMNSLKWKMFAYGASIVYKDHINQLRANIGLPAIKLDYDHMVRVVLNKPMITATIYSTCLLARPADWPDNDLMVGPLIPDEDEVFQPSGDLLEFLGENKNEKIVYVGIGSMMSMMFAQEEQREFLNNIQMAIGNNLCKAIVSLVGFQPAERDNLSSTAKIFYLQQAIPHTWLFPHVSAAIHHGGAGTTHASLQCGLPALILPFGADQPFNADRIFINKLGPKPIPARQANAKNLTQAIRDLLNNDAVYRANAQRSAQIMRDENGLRRCIEMVENS